jgi:hypothetical protein|tara:strand:- start:10640 stop:10756 length:117 start_codon:yes stop_codon:yes gene_type:complete
MFSANGKHEAIAEEDKKLMESNVDCEDLTGAVGDVELA